MSTSIIDQRPLSISGMHVRDRCPRVLYVVSTGHSGGLEVASVRQAAMLMRTQPSLQTIIFACRKGQFVDQNCADFGIPTREFMLANSGDLHGVSRLAQIITDDDIDIVHVHSRRDYVAARMAVTKVRRNNQHKDVKLIFHLHLIRNLGAPSLLSGYYFGQTVDKFIAVSNAVKAHLLRKHKNLSETQIAVVPNGIEFDKYVRDPFAGRNIRRYYGIPDKAIVIGMIGRLDTKGQDSALRALVKLNRPDVFMVIVGSAGKKRYQEYLDSIVAGGKIGDRVKFCGPQADIAPYLSAMDFLVHLPLDEAFGLAPAEAMSAGLPVIVSNCAGCKELVTNEVDGLIVSPKDINKITESFARLIDNPALRLNLGTTASHSVKSRFSISSQADSLTRIYSELLETTS